MSRIQKLLLCLALLLVVIVGAVLLALSFGASPRPQTPTPVPTTSISPSPDVGALNTADQSEIEEKSRSLAIAYFSYDNPGSPNYAASVRPFVTDEFFRRVVADNAKAAKFDITAIRSEVKNVVLSSAGESVASAAVELQTTEPATSRSYAQHITVSWSKTGGAWSATDIQLDSTDNPDDTTSGGSNG